MFTYSIYKLIIIAYVRHLKIFNKVLQLLVLILRGSTNDTRFCHLLHSVIYKLVYIIWKRVLMY